MSVQLSILAKILVCYYRYTCTFHSYFTR